MKIFKITSLGSIIAFLLTIIWNKIITYQDYEIIHFSIEKIIEASIIATFFHFGLHFQLFKYPEWIRRVRIFSIILALFSIAICIIVNSLDYILILVISNVFIIKLFLETILLKKNYNLLFLGSMIIEPFVRLSFISSNIVFIISCYLILYIIYLIPLLLLKFNFSKNKSKKDFLFLSLYFSELIGLLIIKSDQLFALKYLGENTSIIYFMIISLISIPLKMFSLLGRAQTFSHIESKSKLFLTKILSFAVLISLISSFFIYFLWDFIISFLYNESWIPELSQYSIYVFLLITPLVLNQILSVFLSVNLMMFNLKVKLVFLIIFLIFVTQVESIENLFLLIFLINISQLIIYLYKSFSFYENSSSNIST